MARAAASSNSRLESRGGGVRVLRAVRRSADARRRAVAERREDEVLAAVRPPRERGAHDVIARIEPGTSCIALVPRDSTASDVLAGAMQVKARCDRHSISPVAHAAFAPTTCALTPAPRRELRGAAKSYR